MRWQYVLIIFFTLTVAAGCKKVTGSAASGGQQTDGIEIPLGCQNADESAKNLYMEDAMRLAVRLIRKEGGPSNGSVFIPDSYSLPILNALVAVYNATSFPERDEVVDKYKIHTFSSPFMSELLMQVDNSYGWVKQWENGSQETGNPDIDMLMKTYELTMKTYYKWSIGDYVVLSAKNPLNLEPLAKQFSAIPGVISASEEVTCCDGNNIQLNLFSDYMELTYSLGSGDCPAGCTYRHFWTFRVYSDCSVTFANHSGDPLEDYQPGL